MNRSLTLLFVLLTASVTACGHEAPPAGVTQTTAPSVQQAATTAAVDSTVASKEAANDAANDQPVGTTSLERVAELPAQQQLPNGRWKPGVNYDPIVPAQPKEAPANKVEVMEVFWYACPHCYELESYLSAWRKTKAPYIEFVRVPVMWGPVHRAHAQLYYTLKELGRNDLDQKVFDTLHSGANPLVGNTPDETFQRQLEWATANGISADAFKKAYNSFAVNSDLQHAQDITERYHVEGVPFIAIDGKYATDVGKAGANANSIEAAHQDLIQLINDLAASEHEHQH